MLAGHITYSMLTHCRLVLVGMSVYHQECRFSCVYPELEEVLGRKLRPTDPAFVGLWGVSPPMVLLMLAGPFLLVQESGGLLPSDMCFHNAVRVGAIQQTPNVLKKTNLASWVLGRQFKGELQDIGRLVQIVLEFGI